MCVCVSFCSHWFLSHVKSNWGVWDIFGAGLAKACRILSFTQFHAISRNFSYFSHFWYNFNMLGIKMHVLKLRDSLVIFSQTFTHFHTIFTQFHTILSVSAIFGTISTCWVVKSVFPSWKIQWRYWLRLLASKRDQRPPTAICTD